jgi:hypothetical protein
MKTKITGFLFAAFVAACQTLHADAATPIFADDSEASYALAYNGAVAALNAACPSGVSGVFVESTNLWWNGSDWQSPVYVRLGGYCK